MAEISVNNEIYLISKGLYRKVSEIVGPECIVNLRRQQWNIRDAFVNCESSLEITHVSSGSKAEGFDFIWSDTDVMYVERNAIVVTSSTLITVPRNNIVTILLMETEKVSPGFAFVRCLKCNDNNTDFLKSLVRRGSDIYVSSKRNRETFMSTSISTCHGPCQTSTYFGFESDYAYTLYCPIWPLQAFSFVKRSIDRDWPSYSILKDICKEGCLLVPINSKQQSYSDMIDLEWRISFSLAEKKLVHSMNHCQFLCYGLSKLFLKECLKENFPAEDLLCSYFMKTAVFWEISENPREWCPINFLSKFWNVFRRLIKWVSIGYCPNFFIPENNMFHGKIYGGAQKCLLGRLRNLYKDGYRSLLRCSSLNEDLSQLITQPELSYTISCNEEDYVSLSLIEREILFAILEFDQYITVKEIKKVMKTLKNVAMLNIDSREIMFAVRLMGNHVLQAYAESLFLSKRSVNSRRNRKHYKDLKMVQTVLHQANTFCYMGDFILIKYMYITGSYHIVKTMIHFIKRELQSQLFTYKWKLNDDIIMSALEQGMPYDTLIETLIIENVKMETLTTIEELKLECLATEETTGGSILFIPPLVFLHFLLLLSYTRLGENHRRQEVLDELQKLLSHDDGNHIIITSKAISWEILGICQELCGDHGSAQQSYINAFYDKHNLFKQATAVRIIASFENCRNVNE